MASRRLTASLAYPRRVGSTRGATRVDYHSLILVIGLLTLAASAGVLYLSQASMVAALRFRLSSAEWEKQALWEQNLALREAACTAERLATVEERAARLGMVNAPATGDYVACVVPGAEPAVARRIAGSARVVEGQEQASGPLDSLLSGLRDRASQPTSLTAMDAGRH